MRKTWGVFEIVKAGCFPGQRYSWGHWSSAQVMSSGETSNDAKTCTDPHRKQRVNNNNTFVEQMRRLDHCSVLCNAKKSNFNVDPFSKRWNFPLSAGVSSHDQVGVDACCTVQINGKQDRNNLKITKNGASVVLLHSIPDSPKPPTTEISCLTGIGKIIEWLLVEKWRIKARAREIKPKFLCWENVCSGLEKKSSVGTRRTIFDWGVKAPLESEMSYSVTRLVLLFKTRNLSKFCQRALEGI